MADAFDTPLLNQEEHRAYAVLTNLESSPLYYLPYTYLHSYPSEQWSYWSTSERCVHSWFFHYWHFSLAIVLAYVVGIHALQKWMRHRRAYSLKWALVAWNSALAVFSLVGTWRLSEEFWHVLLVGEGFRASICYTVDPVGPAAFWVTLFVVSKVGELFDTVLVVLRKRPLIFLHWYHHAMVLIACWHSARDLTAAGRWFVYMNFAVHSVMYTYYAVVSSGLRLPKPISIIVTSLQTGQMLVGVGISLCLAHMKITEPDAICQQTSENLALCFLIYISFAFLFARFFLRAYVLPGKGEPSPGWKSGEGKHRLHRQLPVSNGEVGVVMNGGGGYPAFGERNDCNGKESKKGI